MKTTIKRCGDVVLWPKLSEKKILAFDDNSLASYDTVGKSLNIPSNIFTNSSTCLLMVLFVLVTIGKYPKPSPAIYE